MSANFFLAKGTLGFLSGLGLSDRNHLTHKPQKVYYLIKK